MQRKKNNFQAAVSSKVEEIKEQLESQYSEELKTSVEQVKSDLSEAVDKYLSYVAEEWSKENELAIERRFEIENDRKLYRRIKNIVRRTLC